jgi:nitrogen regulatory protein PII-like uncharacterized protein
VGLLSSEQNDKVSDTTDDDSSIKAGNKEQRSRKIVEKIKEKLVSASWRITAQSLNYGITQIRIAG